MITAEQIRAARALLNWKQSDLAKKSGLSLPSINNVERQIGSPRISTLDILKKTLQNAGIEFIDDSGVKKLTEIFEIKNYQGDDFIKKQNDDLFFCMRNSQDEALMCGLDERMFPKHAPDQVLRYDKHQKKTQFKQRIIVKENDHFFLTDTSAYRWISPEILGVVPFLVYHDRLVMIMWKEKRTIIIRSQAIADTYKAQFEFLWAQAKPIAPNFVNKLDDPSYYADLNKGKK